MKLINVEGCLMGFSKENLCPWKNCCGENQTYSWQMNEEITFIQASTHIHVHHERATIDRNATNPIASGSLVVGPCLTTVKFQLQVRMYAPA